jgi:hypothetical protein
LPIVDAQPPAPPSAPSNDAPSVAGPTSTGPSSPSNTVIVLTSSPTTSSPTIPPVKKKAAPKSHHKVAKPARKIVHHAIVKFGKSLGVFLRR